MATPSHPPPLADRPASAGESPPSGWLSALSARGERDFRLALIFMIGLTGMLVVGGFAIYRFSSGNLIGGFVNLAIVLALGGILLWAAAGAATRHVGPVFIAAVTLAAISSVFVFGRTGLYWTFLVLWVSFVLAPPRLAALSNSALLLAVLVGNHAVRQQHRVDRLPGHRRPGDLGRLAGGHPAGTPARTAAGAGR
jgi:hypothetical protein